MSYVSTPFIFQLDVDFLPQYGLHESLMSYIVKINISESDKVALIDRPRVRNRTIQVHFPVEWIHNAWYRRIFPGCTIMYAFRRFTFPADKNELLKFLKRGVLYTFRYHVWTQGHAATNYSYWRNTVEPYEVCFRTKRRSLFQRVGARIEY